MQAVRPENVVLEVCRSRTAVLYDELLQEAGTPGTSGRAATSTGRAATSTMSLRCCLSCCCLPACSQTG